MAIRLHCPNGHAVRVNDEFAGKIGLCPKCRAKVQVPLPRQADHLRPSEEFVHQDPRHDRAIAGTGSGPLMPPFPSKKTKLCVGCGHMASQSFAVCPRCGTPLATYRRLDVRKEGEVIIVRFAEHQIREEPTVREIADELCNLAERVPQQRLVLDFSGVVGLSSLMLGKLVMLQMRMKKSGGNLRLRNVGSEVREILATTRLDHAFQIEDDQVFT